MADTFASNASGLDSPASKAAAISPNDSTDLTTATRGIYVGGAGNLVAIFAGDTTAVTCTGLLAGQVYPFRLSRVKSTGTTATSLLGLS